MKHKDFNIKTKFEKLRPLSSTDIKLWIAYAYHLEGYIEGLQEGIGFIRNEQHAKQEK